MTALCGPVVAKETMNLAHFVNIGMSKKTMVHFTQEIHWVLEISPTIRFTHGGMNVKNTGSWCDAGSFMSSLEDAVDSAKDQCEFFSVTMESSMVIEVVALVEHVPVVLRFDSHERKLFGRYVYSDVPFTWLIPDQTQRQKGAIAAYEGMDANPYVTQPYQEAVQWPSLDRKQIVKQTIWSSKLPDAINALMTHRFKERWQIPSITPQNT